MIGIESMTHRDNYAALIDGIFGAGAASFDITVPGSNKVIGALANSKNFSAFKSNFEHRLQRLNAAIQADESLRVEILAAVNKIVDRGWDGAYAELCALDYFLAASMTGPGNIVLDRTVPASHTLAADMGMEKANHDMSFPNLGITMDTKLLSDKTGDILEKIFQDFRKAKGINRLTIFPSYDQDQNFSDFEENRKKLLDELLREVDTTIRPARLISKVVPGLSYEIAWTAGVHTAAGSYSPSEHAKNHHHLLFGHAKKFSKIEPTVIVFVIFPWTSESVFLFDETKKPFFKEFGETFFSGYIASTDLARKFNGKVKTSILASDLTKHLSGIIFLDDNSILAGTPAQVNVAASFLWNRNALLPLSGSTTDTYMRDRGAFNLETLPLAEQS